MNGKSMLLAGIVTLLAALAANGAAAFQALAGLPLVLNAFAGGLPLGLVSFVLAGALAVLAWWHADRRLHYGKSGTPGRDFRSDNLALLVAVAATMAQTVVVRGSSSSALLQALMLGILAGLLAPIGGRAMLAIGRRLGL